MRYYFRNDTRAFIANATQNALAMAQEPGGGRESTDTSMSAMRRVTKHTEDFGKNDE